MNIDGFMTAKIRDFFEYTIAGEWGSEGNLETDTPVLRSTNFTNKGKIDYSDIAYRKIDSSCISRRLVNRETILIEKSGGSPSQPAGRVVYCEEDFIGGASNFIEIAKTNNLYCAKYIFFLLHYLYQTGLVLKYQQQTTGIINFKLEQYKDEEVLFASDKKEQEKIAAVLSTIDRAIAQTEAIIAKQQRIKTGLMQDLLTKGIDENGNIRSEDTHQFKDSAIGRIPVEWKVVTINDISTKITDGDHHTPDRSVDGIFLLSARNILNGSIDISDVDYVPDREYQRMIKRCYPEAGDILISCSGTIGRVCQVSTWLKCVLVRSAALVKLNKSEVYPRFAEWVLRSELLQAQIQVSQRQAAQPNLFQSEIASLNFAKPILYEQVEISKILDKHHSLIKRSTLSLNKLQYQKTGLMQDLLTGKVRVTNLLKEKEPASG